jgi:hypothetical protein
MMKSRFSILFITVVIALGLTSSLMGQPYNWLEEYDSSASIINRIEPPPGYERISVKPGSFAEWLRFLPLKEAGSPVYLYSGIRKGNQTAHIAVIDIDVGEKDIQQCADAIIRLRAEYLFSKHDFDSISFNFTSGDTASFRKWITGFRPQVKGNNVTWAKTNDVDSTYYSLRDYLEDVFNYAGSYSLARQLKPKQNVRDISIGDVFIQGGFPGHAVIVVDVALNNTTGEKIFLLAQSYMPAQDIHILKNPDNSDSNPWYEGNFGDVLYTPEWNFDANDIKEF